MLMQMAMLFGFGQAYHVGDLYVAPDGSQGVVFFVHADGGGWAVALQDEDNILPWSTTAVDVPALTNYGAPFAQAPVADTSGYANTQTIRNYLGASNNYAAGAVDFDHGWYVPAMAQLCLIYAQLPLIQAALILVGGTPLDISYDPYNTSGQNSAYWSSTEANSEYAWFMIFYDDTNLSNSYSDHTGTPMKTPKNQSNYRVRAVCSFPPRENVYDSTLTYLWNTGSTEPHFHDVPLQNTTYTVTVGYGPDLTCPQSASISVDELITPTAQINTRPNHLSYDHPNWYADDASEGETDGREWYVNGEYYSQQSQHIDGVIETNPFGDDDSITLMLVVYSDLCSDTAEAVIPMIWSELWVPNVFTPSLDHNNLFGADGVGIIEYEIWIYTREGLRVFHSTSMDDRWDGKHEGTDVDCKQEAYTYRINYRFASKPEELQTKVGLVLLLR